MPTAEILTIGTEILLGEIQDTNTSYLARILKDLGVDLYRTQTVGDNAARIATILRDILTRADLVITTGGLGPTVDDPTRQAVADAFNLPLVFREDCWHEIQAYFERIGRNIPVNNQRQAYLPETADTDPQSGGNSSGFHPGAGRESCHQSARCAKRDGMVNTGNRYPIYTIPLAAPFRDSHTGNPCRRDWGSSTR